MLTSFFYQQEVPRTLVHETTAYSSLPVIYLAEHDLDLKRLHRQNRRNGRRLSCNKEPVHSPLLGRYYNEYIFEG